MIGHAGKETQLLVSSLQRLRSTHVLTSGTVDGELSGGARVWRVGRQADVFHGALGQRVGARVPREARRQLQASAQRSQRRQAPADRPLHLT